MLKIAIFLGRGAAEPCWFAADAGRTINAKLLFTRFSVKPCCPSRQEEPGCPIVSTLPPWSQRAANR
jgi:hypothetical protein